MSEMRISSLLSNPRNDLVRVLHDFSKCQNAIDQSRRGCGSFSQALSASELIAPAGGRCAHLSFDAPTPTRMSTLGRAMGSPRRVGCV